MSGLTNIAKSAVLSLLKLDEEQLYEQLGILAWAIAEDPSNAGSFELPLAYNEEMMGPREDLREFGQRLFRRWNVETYKLICGDDIRDMIDRRELIVAFGENDVAVAAALSTLLVTHVGLAPSLAVVVASLVIKRFSSPGHEQFCKVWKRKLRKYE